MTVHRRVNHDPTSSKHDFGRWLTEIVPTEIETVSNTVSAGKMAWSGAAGIWTFGSVFCIFVEIPLIVWNIISTEVWRISRRVRWCRPRVWENSLWREIWVRNFQMSVFFCDFCDFGNFSFLGCRPVVLYKCSQQITPFLSLRFLSVFRDFCFLADFLFSGDIWSKTDF